MEKILARGGLSQPEKLLKDVLKATDLKNLHFYRVAQKTLPFDFDSCLFSGEIAIVGVFWLRRPT